MGMAWDGNEDVGNLVWPRMGLGKVFRPPRGIEGLEGNDSSVPEMGKLWMSKCSRSVRQVATLPPSLLPITPD